MPKGYPNNPKPKPAKPVEQAYINGPGKPIIHNGCGMCGRVSGHSDTCPRRG